MAIFYPNDILTPTFLTGAIENRPTKEAIRQSYVGSKWLPFRDVDERKLSWDVMYSENNLAGVYGPKGQAIPGDDVLFSTVFANLIDVKASRHLDPTIVQQIRDPGMPAVYKAGGASHTVKSLQQRISRHVRERIAWCDDAVDSQIEYFAMQGLQGSIVWPPLDDSGTAISVPMPHWNADMAVSVTFPLPALQNQAASTLAGYDAGSGARSGGGFAWTNSSANPILDLEVINEYMVRTLGVNLRGGTIIMSETVLSRMAFLPNVIRWVAATDYSQDGAREFIDVGRIKSLIQSRLGWTIETYDAQWTFRTHVPTQKPTITRVSYMTEGKVLIFPPGGPVGNMATTWQETDTGAWKTGKLAWDYRAPKPPFEVEVGVNLVGWPIFEHYDWFVLDSFS